MEYLLRSNLSSKSNTPIKYYSKKSKPEPKTRAPPKNIAGTAPEKAPNDKRSFCFANDPPVSLLANSTSTLFSLAARRAKRFRARERRKTARTKRIPFNRGSRGHTFRDVTNYALLTLRESVNSAGDQNDSAFRVIENIGEVLLPTAPLPAVDTEWR
ncbi:hypothetical protein CDAR_127681 [Caerostris darwini]|uniref:Uncharacterized protein n=1 Tax=Caerostris darwini TaxID=1538125 RepID=A0AAV4QAD5_9ARAC|nr:hypothetical protein CDAR_127681 [Caerostris darwini]